MKPLTIAFWNRSHTPTGGRAAQAEYLASCPVPWDLLVLCEVTQRSYEDFAAAIEPNSSEFSLDRVAVNDMRQPNGVALLARSNLTLDHPEVAHDPSRDGLRVRSERLLAVSTTIDDHPVRIVGWHAPYAAGGRQQEKRHAYRYVTEWLATQSQPLILGMDGNNWYDWLTPTNGDPEALHERHDEWDYEQRFHGPTPAHGLVDTLRLVASSDLARRNAYQPGRPLAVTKMIKEAGPQRMDRIYVTPDPALQIQNAGVEHTRGTTDKKLQTVGSDHALVWATVEVDPSSTQPSSP